MITSRSARDDPIRRQHLAWRKIAQTANALIQGTKVDARQLQQLLQVSEHEIGLLEVVDAVVRAHHPPKVEADAVGGRIVEGEDTLGVGGGDAGAINAQPSALLDQSELDRVPVDACQ